MGAPPEGAGNSSVSEPPQLKMCSTPTIATIKTQMVDRSKDPNLQHRSSSRVRDEGGGGAEERRGSRENSPGAKCKDSYEAVECALAFRNRQKMEVNVNPLLERRYDWPTLQFGDQNENTKAPGKYEAGFKRKG